MTRSGERRGAYWVLVGNSEGETPLGKLGLRSVHKIKIDIQ